MSIYDTAIRYDFDDSKSRGLEISLWLIDHKEEVSNWILIDDDERIDYEKFSVLSLSVYWDNKRNSGNCH